jgi:AbrB family looped-hinge helix DNA binding protein
MEYVTVSSKGQIAIPKRIRETLNLGEGSKLALKVRGQEIVLSKGAGWKNLRGSGGDLMDVFAKFRVKERERENARS